MAMIQRVLSAYANYFCLIMVLKDVDGGRQVWV